MLKIPGNAARFPEVHLFFRDNTVLRLRLIRSDGQYLLCCNDGGDASLVPFSLLYKVSPQTSGNWVCRLDEVTGVMWGKGPDGRFASFGPIRGQFDTAANLRKTAEDLGLDWRALTAATGAPAGAAVPVRPAVSRRKIGGKPVEPVPAEAEAVPLPDFTEVAAVVPALDDLEIKFSDLFSLKPEGEERRTARSKPDRTRKPDDSG